MSLVNFRVNFGRQKPYDGSVMIQDLKARLGGDKSFVQSLESLRGQTVVVAMSGGVDSSLVAGLLKAHGLKVIGLTLQLYDHAASAPSARSCCAGRDIHDARRVAASLDIPHYVLDYQKDFHESVIEDFASSYAHGETPVPCTRCNERVKFSKLLDFAREIGAQALATGHYIRREQTQEGLALYRARDLARDQSYFLFTMNAEQLAFSHFPLGGLHKDEVRALASELNLPVAAKPDSQDICFVPSGRYTDLVKRLRPEVQRAGDIIHLDGTYLGRHEGLYQFTIGQRRGLGVFAEEPLYVVGLDVARALLIVGARADCAVRHLTLSGVNWLGAPPPPNTPDGSDVLVKLRSSQEPLAARLEISRSGVEVALKQPEIGIASGQACVFYQSCGNKERMLGGGWIEQTDLTRLVAHIAGSHQVDGASGQEDRMKDKIMSFMS